MRLNVAEREAFRERVKKVISHMKKSEIVEHFTKEGVARRTIYNTIDRLQSTRPVTDKKGLAAQQRGQLLKRAN